MDFEKQMKNYIFESNLIHMRFFLTITIIVLCFNFISQEKTTYKVGDEIEYFDGVNWIESSIIQINNNLFQVYTNRLKTQTKWTNSDNIQLLYKDDAPIIKTNITVTETIVTPKFHITDIVKYLENDRWIKSEIINLGPDYTYQLYLDTNKTGVIWKSEQEIQLISSNFEQIKTETVEHKNSHKIGDIVEYYENEKWKKGKIIEIDTNGMLIFNNSNEQFFPNELRIISSENNTDQNPDYFDIGEKIIVFDGKKWIESEILQINDYMQYQVYYNVEKTITKWVENKDLKLFK
jgi:hypothetical protein